jgi:hypothetical protein
MSERYELLLNAEGGAELLSSRGSTLWASDSDEEFQEAFADREILDENDIDDVLEYLVDAGELTEREADDCTIEVESLAGPGDEDDEDDEDDAQLEDTEAQEYG